MLESFINMWMSGDFDAMIEELDASFIIPQRKFEMLDNGDIFFCYRGSRKATSEIISKHFKNMFGVEPEIRVDVEEYEKWLGEDEYGQEMITIRYYNNTTIVFSEKLLQAA